MCLHSNGGERKLTGVNITSFGHRNEEGGERAAESVVSRGHMENGQGLIVSSFDVYNYTLSSRNVYAPGPGI